MSRKIFLGVTIKDHAITITFFELYFVHIYCLLVFIFIWKFCLDLKTIEDNLLESAFLHFDEQTNVVTAKILEMFK